MAEEWELEFCWRDERDFCAGKTGINFAKGATFDFLRSHFSRLQTLLSDEGDPCTFGGASVSVPTASDFFARLLGF